MQPRPTEGKSCVVSIKADWSSTTILLTDNYWAR